MSGSLDMLFMKEVLNKTTKLGIAGGTRASQERLECMIHRVSNQRFSGAISEFARNKMKTSKSVVSFDIWLQIKSCYVHFCVVSTDAPDRLT